MLNVLDVVLFPVANPNINWIKAKKNGDIFTEVRKLPTSTGTRLKPFQGQNFFLILTLCIRKFQKYP